MLFDYAYLINNVDASFFNDTDADVYDFILPINEQITGRKPEIFQILFESKNRFCFYIPVELTLDSGTFIKKETIQNIFTFLFLPNYLRINQKHIIFVEKSSQANEAYERLKDEFYNELRKQGINDFIAELIETEPSADIFPPDGSEPSYHRRLNDYLNSPDEGASFDAFTNSFVFPDDFYKKWIVPVADKDSFRKKRKLLEKFENWVSYTDPFTAKLAGMYRVAIQNKAALESDNAILKFRLDSYAYSLEVIREEAVGHLREVLRLNNELQRGQYEAEQKRSNQLLTWYHDEYEVLPLWYKRFGHIIKVFTGKRTFKSLFK